MKKQISLLFIAVSLTAQLSGTESNGTYSVKNRTWSLSRDPNAETLIVNNISCIKKKLSIDVHQMGRIGWLAAYCAYKIPEGPFCNATAVTSGSIIVGSFVTECSDSSTNAIINSLMVSVPAFFLCAAIRTFTPIKDISEAVLLSKAGIAGLLYLKTSVEKGSPFPVTIQNETTESK